MAQCRQPVLCSHHVHRFLSALRFPIALAAVAFVLLLGLINMMRGGSPNTSQRLMRLRVLLQFVAIVIAMVAVWAMAKLIDDSDGFQR